MISVRALLMHNFRPMFLILLFTDPLHSLSLQMYCKYRRSHIYKVLALILLNIAGVMLVKFLYHSFFHAFEHGGAACQDHVL